MRYSQINLKWSLNFFKIFRNYLRSVLQKHIKKYCWKNNRVYLSNTPLTKNQRFKKCLKAMFEKHTLRTIFFFLIKIEHVKHDFKLMDLAQPCGLGFLAQIPNLKTPSRIRNEKLKIKQGFFTWISSRTVKNNIKNLEMWILI